MKYISPKNCGLFFISLLTLGLFQETFSQDRKGLTGIGIQVSSPPIYNSPFFLISSMEMQPDILVSYWISDRIAIEPTVGILAYTNETYWRLGLAMVSHFNQERLSPFFLIRWKAFLLSDNGRNSEDHIIGIAVGGEYFVAEKFSISGEAQLNYSIPDKERSLFVRRNTTTTGVGIAGRFYLN
ncbi:MAG: hypothetical protein HYV29_08580 [Ignavibacteriales bacterium]|nr:hypothetical protein [Ignavibacteriales bacterium]